LGNTHNLQKYGPKKLNGNITLDKNITPLKHHDVKFLTRNMNAIKLLYHIHPTTNPQVETLRNMTANLLSSLKHKILQHLQESNYLSS
jgi:hypothetical protein